MTRRARAAGGTCHAHCGVVAIHRSSCQEKRWSTNRRSTKRRSSSDSARSGRLRKRVVAWRWRTGRTRTTGTIRITRVVPPPDGCALRSSRSARNRRSRRTAASRPCSLAPGTRPAGLTQRSLIADAAARLCDPASSRRIAIRESPNDAGPTRRTCGARGRRVHHTPLRRRGMIAHFSGSRSSASNFRQASREPVEPNAVHRGDHQAPAFHHDRRSRTLGRNDFRSGIVRLEAMRAVVHASNDARSRAGVNAVVARNALHRPRDVADPSSGEASPNVVCRQACPSALVSASPEMPSAMRDSRSSEIRSAKWQRPARPIP